MKTGSETLGSKLYRLKIYHVILWISYYIFFLILYRKFYTSSLDLLGVISLYFVFNAAPFYIINYYPLPRLLQANRISLFIGLTLGTLILSIAGLSISLYAVFHEVTDYKLAYAVIAGFSSVGLTVGGLSAGKVMVDKIRNEALHRTREHNQLKTELLYLKAQVNPHFLFNAINSIYVLILKDPQKAAETLIKLSDLLRFQLYDCTDDKIPIEKELAYIQNFILLEKIRKGEKLQIDFQTEGDLSAFELAPFLSVPFLENAFKFVSNYTEKPNEVRIKMKRHDNHFEATFFNTCESSVKAEVGGIGLKNVMRRLELLYPGRHTLVVEGNQDSWLSTLTLELK